MATDDADSAPSALEGEVQEGAEPADGAGSGPGAVVGSYTWDDFLREHGETSAASTLYERFEATPGSDRWGEEDRTLTPEDWERTDVDPADYLGFPPWEIEARIGAAARVGEEITESSPLIGYENTPVIKDIYGWEDYKRQYFYTDEGEPPTDKEGEPETFDDEAALGHPPESIGATMADCERAGEELQELIDERTVDVDEEVDEDAFFSDPQGRATVANRYDLEKTVPMAKKSHFREEDRYWVNKPFSYVVIFHSTKENEIKYYVVQPHLTEIEEDLSEYLTDKLRASIKYEDESGTAGDEDHRRSVIEGKTRELLERYDLYTEPEEGEERGGLGNTIADKFGIDPSSGVSGRVIDLLGYEEPIGGVRQLEGIEVRPEPVLLEEDEDTLNEYQVEKLLYYLERDFIGYERIDGIKHDINVEDISCDGYNSPVFVYHSDYEQIITNVYHGEKELDDFVVKLAQRSGKGISKRRPQVDATLPDGSRAQLTLGREVSDHGTNYTIRQFKDVPFTPVDLINWQTFSLDEMAFLWLCIENHKSLIFAGGTASGKTTSLNAVSLFIPSNSKIVSIEDTREVELPQRNWIASVTRPSFSDDDKGDVDEFDLLEAALRQRPDYIVMGEIRGEEGRTLFQVMSTGHTTYTTFHADNVGEVLKRFTTEPINVSKTMFTALDLVSIQTSTRVQGHKVRRNKSLTEINHYDAENDEINVQDVYQWQAETDEFLKMGDSNTLDEIMFDRGWDRDKLDDEIFKRQTVLAYLIHEGLNTYTQVAATFQAFINDPETILSLMANDMLESSLEDLREMESVLIDIDPEKEEMVPRPDPNEEIMAEAKGILDEAEERLFDQYHGETPDDVVDALVETQTQENVEAASDAAGELPAAAEEAVELDEDQQGRSAISDVAEGDDDADIDATPELEAGDESEEPSIDEGSTADTAPDDGATLDEESTIDTESVTEEPSTDEESTDDNTESTVDDAHEFDEDDATEADGGLQSSRDGDESTEPAFGSPDESNVDPDPSPEPDEWDPFDDNGEAEYVIGVPEEEDEPGDDDQFDTPQVDDSEPVMGADVADTGAEPDVAGSEAESDATGSETEPDATDEAFDDPFGSDGAAPDEEYATGAAAEDADPSGVSPGTDDDVDDEGDSEPFDADPFAANDEAEEAPGDDTGEVPGDDTGEVPGDDTGEVPGDDAGGVLGEEADEAPAVGREEPDTAEELPDGDEVGETPDDDHEGPDTAEELLDDGDAGETLGTDVDETPDSDMGETPGADVGETPDAEMGETTDADVDETPHDDARETSEGPEGSLDDDHEEPDDTDESADDGDDDDGVDVDSWELGEDDRSFWEGE